MLDSRKKGIYPVAASPECEAYRRAANILPRFDTANKPGLLSADGSWCNEIPIELNSFQRRQFVMRNFPRRNLTLNGARARIGLAV